MLPLLLLLLRLQVLSTNTATRLTTTTTSLSEGNELGEIDRVSGGRATARCAEVPARCAEIAARCAEILEHDAARCGEGEVTEGDPEDLPMPTHR